jgi:hypothetical protein
MTKKLTKDQAREVLAGLNAARKKGGERAVGVALAGRIEGALRLIKELEKNLTKRIAALEAMPVRFCGTHEPGLEYGERSLVVADGSLWFARQKTQAKPGTSSAWQLCVKSGTLSLPRHARTEPRPQP